jgi:hypothetical protein
MNKFNLYKYRRRLLPFVSAKTVNSLNFNSDRQLISPERQAELKKRGLMMDK